MILLATTGNGSLDIYSQKLSKNLNVPVVRSDVYQKFIRCRSLSWWSPWAVRTIWHDWRFIQRLNRLGDAVHLPNHHFGRYGNFLRVPFIITVMDLIRYLDLKGYGTFVHRPNSRDRFYLNLDYKGIKKAARIIAISQATKNDLIHYLNIPEERISVVYLGVDPKVFCPVPHRLYNHPYVLFVGSEQPRKNLVQLLKAFSWLKKETRFKDLKLVKVGEAGGEEADFRKQTMKVINSLNLNQEVIIVDRVPESELPVYYSGAAVFVLPSLYEGFGLPPLEAMACGCPVITSNATSLPEVVGDAGIMVDPYDTDNLAKAMRQVLTNDELRADMVRKGLEQSKQFSWEKAAEQTQEIYNKVAELRL